MDFFKIGLVITPVLLGFWTNSVQQRGFANQREIENLKAALVQKDNEFKAQLVTVNNKVDACEQKYDKKLKEIEDTAKRLPPSSLKRKILTLTKPPKQSGAVTQPLRANEPVPRIYANTELPAIKDERYFDWRQTN